MSKDGKKLTPAKTKSVSRQSLERGEMADTGGDKFDRANNQYSKNPPVRDEDPFAPYNNF